MIITLQARNTITIPSQLRRHLHLEPGAALDAKVEAGQLVLTPVEVVPRALSLTRSGLAKELEADADIEAGRVSQLDSVDELLAVTAK